MKLRRTKIVVTLGPATDTRSILTAVLETADAVRLNMSHGCLDDHAKRIKMVREIAQASKRDIGIFADLQGPKIRIGRFAAEDGVSLTAGASFCLDLACDPDAGTNERVWFDYSGLIQDIATRTAPILLLDDGKIKLSVEQIEERSLVCRVITGGWLSNRKGVSVFGGGICAPMLTEKDLLDLERACQLDVDMIALSFPSCGDDILRARELIDAHDTSIGIIAKIERQEAIDNLNEIVQNADTVMVARGDLALEVGEEDVPILQKYIIKQARLKHTPIIVATQMMESMITSATPTRAEVSDVANAVLDGADCVMLSAETATGAYPVEVVCKVDSICLHIEKHALMQKSDYQDKLMYQTTDESIAYAAMYLANRSQISAIIALTEFGRTPRIMSRVRTGIPIYALSRRTRARARMSLMKDVFPVPFQIEHIHTSRALVVRIVVYLLSLGILQESDYFLLTHGDDLSGRHATSTLKLFHVADVVAYKEMQAEGLTKKKEGSTEC